MKLDSSPGTTANRKIVFDLFFDQSTVVNKSLTEAIGTDVLQESFQLRGVMQLYPVINTDWLSIELNDCEDFDIAEARLLLSLSASLVRTSARQLEYEKKIVFSSFEQHEAEHQFAVDLLSLILPCSKDVRFLLFYSCDQKRIVADVSLASGRLYFKKEIFDFENNDEFFSTNLRGRDDEYLRNLWYQLTLERALLLNDGASAKTLSTIKPDKISTMADIHYCNAMASFKHGDRDNAMAALFKAIELLPYHIPSVRQLALQLLHEKNYVLALQYLTELLLIEPSDRHLLLKHKLDCLNALDMKEDFHNTIRDLITMTPKECVPWLVSFSSQFEIDNQLDLARFCYESLVEKYEQELVIVHGNDEVEKKVVLKSLCICLQELAHFEYRSGNEHVALEVIKKIFKHDTSYFDAHMLECKILVELKMVSELERAVEHFLVSCREPTEAFLFGGALSILKKDFEQAISFYERALKVRPTNNYVAHHGCGQAFAWMGKFEKAVEAYSQSLKIYSTNCKCLSDLGSALLNLHNLTEALQVINKAIEIQPGYYHPYCVKAGLYLRQGRNEEALSLIAQALLCDRGLAQEYVNNVDDFASMRNSRAYLTLVNA